MRQLLLGLAAAAAVNAAFNPAARPPERGVPMRLSPETAIETAGLLSLGMRRLAADLEVIRMLVYYGTPEEGFGGEELEQGGGQYAELLSRGRRVLELDPKFSYGVLYAAGALAFNLGRPDEALDLLTEAYKKDPGDPQYRDYIGAVAFAKKGDTKRVLELLAPTLSSPDCPTMIKSMVAFMYVRTGQRDQAIRVYRDILASSRDAGYRATARRELARLGAAPQ